MNSNLKEDIIQKEIKAINSIPIVPDILNVITRLTNLRFVSISRMTNEKWIACSLLDKIDFGMNPGDELELDATFCNEVKIHEKPLIINNTDEDKAYGNHWIPVQYGFKSYISYPIYKRDGSFFGTLCALDPNPSQLDTVEIKDTFRLFSELISFHLESIEKMENTSQALKNEKKVSELRDTFIAVLAHDLRNPLGSVSMAAELMSYEENLTDEANKCIKIIQSSAKRVNELIENVLDFAKGNLGEGIVINKSKGKEELEEALIQVIDELKIINQSNNIVSEINLEKNFLCDAERIAQLLSNLLSNALKYGEEDKLITVKAISRSNQFTLSVENYGPPVEEKIKHHLFDPFVTVINKENQKKGLGLGLFISAEIAKAHKGELKVNSENGKTLFEFSMDI